MRVWSGKNAFLPISFMAVVCRLCFCAHWSDSRGFQNSILHWPRACPCLSFKGGDCLVRALSGLGNAPAETLTSRFVGLVRSDFRFFLGRLTHHTRVTGQ